VKTNLMKLRTLRRLILVGGLSVIGVGVIRIGLVQYREAKDIWDGIGILAAGCAAKGGCDLPAAGTFDTFGR
jgi:hypothetical protein